MSDPVPPPRRGREATRQLWAERLARFAGAGLSVAAFCSAEGVPASSFFYWKQRLAAPAPLSDAPPLFLPVHVNPSVPVEIVLPDGATLRVAPGCDLAFVRSLVDALGAPC